MYYIVEKKEQLDRLPIVKSAFIQVVAKNSHYHPKLTSASLVYYNNGEKGYMLCVNHSESFSLDSKDVEKFLNQHETIYLVDAKYHSYFFRLNRVVDANVIMMNSDNKLKDFDCDTQFHRNFYQTRRDLPNVDALIPIAKQYEKCECFYDQVKYLMGLESYDTAYDKLIQDAYKHVEQNGIGVKIEYIEKNYELKNASCAVLDNVIYNSYNLNNVTARPTNSFAGINFLAIPKDGEVRRCFVPTNDFLVEFDFDAYHLRLLANLLGIEVDQDVSLHSQMASQYFNKPIEQVTEEDYKLSKTITFQQLYGGIEDQYKHIPFLENLDLYIDKEWKKYKSQRSYVLPTGRVIRESSTMRKNKLFNYILQNLETKNNVEKILSIQELLKDKKTKLVLITYDAFLFDFSVNDGKDTLVDIKRTLEKNGFKTKHKYGKDYSFTQ